MNVTLQSIMDNMNWSEDAVFSGILDTYTKNNSKFLENFLTTNISLNENLISCKFNSKPCDMNDFEYVVFKYLYLLEIKIT